LLKVSFPARNTLNENPRPFPLAGRRKSRFDRPVKAGEMSKKISRRRNCVFIAAVSLAAASPSANAADTNSIADLFAAPKVELHPVEAIRLETQPPLGREEEERILGLIRNLAKIDSPDFGLSATLSGEAFAPIPAARKAGAFLITNHQIRTSEDFAELVKLGPKALPFLLKALSNQTPTKLVMTHGFGMGGMWFANELRGNPGNQAEQKVLATVPTPGRDFPKDDLSSYTVKIGDVCLVIVGQIVGRPYQAVRYQPSLCTIINSPTHDTNLAQQVSAIWSSQDPAQHLLDSLLLDYASRGVFNGKSLDGWDVGSSLQIGAAMRLLYYYPQQTTNLIAARLRSLDVRKYDMNRDVTNGVRTDEFIKAVAWSKEPAIQAELQKIYEVTADPEILQAAVVAMDPSTATAFRNRMEEFISNLPETEDGPFGESYELLIALGQQFGTEARPAFEHYMQHGSLQRRRSMCRVLAEVQGGWSIDLLGPLLQDTRPAEGWTYAVVPGKDEPRLPVRICDEAAETIARNFPKLSFKMAGEHKDLDRQIEKMSDQIAKHDY
jgi:hypothetical protein